MPGDHAGDDGEGMPAVALQQCQNGASLFFIDMFIFSNIIRSFIIWLWRYEEKKFEFKLRYLKYYLSHDFRTMMIDQFLTVPNLENLSRW